MEMHHVGDTECSNVLQTDQEKEMCVVLWNDEFHSYDQVIDVV